MSKNKKNDGTSVTQTVHGDNIASPVAGRDSLQENRNVSFGDMVRGSQHWGDTDRQAIENCMAEIEKLQPADVDRYTKDDLINGLEDLVERSQFKEKPTESWFKIAVKNLLNMAPRSVKAAFKLIKAFAQYLPSDEK